MGPAGQAADAWGLRVSECAGWGSRRRGTAGEVGAGVRTAGPERMQREAGRTGPSAGLLRIGVEMGRTCGALC